MGSKYLWENKIYLFSFNKTKMMIKTSRILGLLMGFSLLIACDKEENNLGDGLIGDSELNHFTSDSTAITTSYRLIDSVKTLDPNFPIIGASNDAYFGKSQASFFTELNLSQNDLDFGANASLDSIVLNIKYVNFYGDTSLNQHFLVYQLSENVDTAKKYSNQSYQTGAIIGDINFYPQIRSVKTVDGEEEVTFLSQSLKLDDSFGNNILSKSGEDELKNNDNFVDFFNGLLIEPQNEFDLDEGTFVTLNYEASNIQLFYTNDSGSDSLDFIFNTNTTSLSHFEHDLTGSNALTSLEADSNTNELYIQSLAGMDVEFKFPEILESDSIYVNKAVLIMPRNVDTVLNFQTYPNLRLEHYNIEDDEYDAIIDENTYKGDFHPENNQYEFVITRYIQELISGKTDKSLYLRSQSNFSGTKTILNGVNHPDNKIKLHLTYSKEKN